MARALTVPNPLDPFGSGVNVPNPVAPFQTAATAAVDTGKFLAKLSDPHTWVRIGEGLVGIILIGVGVNAMLGNPYGKINSKIASSVVGGSVKSVAGSQIRNAGTRNIRAQEDVRYARIAQSRESARSVGASQREAVRSRGQAQRELFRTEQVKARRKDAS